jgi:plasmid stability protein
MKTIQYTIRNVPPSVDKVLRQRAKHTGKSVNQLLVDILRLSTRSSGQANSIESLFGQGGQFLDDSFDQAIDDLSRIDSKFWNEPINN